MSTLPVYELVTADDVRPSVQDVAMLERTRTLGEFSMEETTFNADTRPSDVDIGRLIDQATPAVLGSLPLRFRAEYFDRARHAVALYTAILVEGSFFREQMSDAQVTLWRNLYNAIISDLRASTDAELGRGSRTVDSVLQRSSMTEYDPMPLPPVPLRIA